jgi:YVTN family beta-propeller protein
VNHSVNPLVSHSGDVLERYSYNGPGNSPDGARSVAVSPGGRTVFVTGLSAGTTAYVVNTGSGTVTPIRTATGTAGKAIKVGDNPIAIAIKP